MVEEKQLTNEQKCSTGLSQELSILIIYALFFFGGLIFLTIEKRNSMVRFHAMQALIWSSAASIVLGIGQLLSFIPLLGYVFGLAVVIGVLVVIGVNVFIVAKSYDGLHVRMPVIAELAQQFLQRNTSH